jgi:hypothetical protein
MDKSRAEGFADTYIEENWGLEGLTMMKRDLEPWKSWLRPHWYQARDFYLILNKGG